MGFPVDQCSFAKAIKFRGVYYVTGSYVVLDKILNDLVLGKVIALFVTSHNPYLVNKKVFAKYFHYYGMLALETNVTNDLTCTEVNQLKDYYPLYSYNLGCSNAVVLKHHICTV